MTISLPITTEEEQNIRHMHYTNAFPGKFPRKNINGLPLSVRFWPYNQLNSFLVEVF
jgi:hypothetical protein